MLHLDLTLPTPAENLACDEALLDWCEGGASPAGLIRFWEAEGPFVVLGYANKAAVEADLEACRAQVVPVLRRCSGGGAVLQGTGCLNYSVILKIDAAGPLGSVSTTNRFVMGLNERALSRLLGRKVAVRGFTDLTLDNLKFSGNAQRRKRSWLLFHGTFLLDFDLSLVERFLRPPLIQPAYRENRPHREFLTRLNATGDSIKNVLREEWNARKPLAEVPRSLIEELVQKKYSQAEWNLKW